MATFNESTVYKKSGLVEAVREGLDLPDDDWEKLWAEATPQQRRVATLITDPTAAPHGSEATYTNWGCRCDECSEVAASARQARRAGMITRDFVATAPTGQTHGTYETFNAGCRCGECTAFIQAKFGTPDESVI